MKKRYKYLLCLFNISLIGMTCFNLFAYDFDKKEVEVSSNDLVKSINSKYINSSNVNKTIDEKGDNFTEN